MMTYEKNLYINSTFIKGEDEPFKVINPYNEELLGEVYAASKEQILTSINSAENALQSYKELHAWQRAEKLLKVAKILQKNKEKYAKILSLETGKPLAQSLRELDLSADQFIWFSEQTKRINGQILPSRNQDTQVLVKYEPIGIAAAFSSWNFPILLSARKLAPALAAGCPMIVRSTELAPLINKCLFEALDEADFPKGMVALLCGSASKISDLIMNDARVRKISLTGSSFVGQQMIKNSSITLKKVTMELGGHAPVIVYDDVKVREVASLSVRVKFANAGQVCVSPTRFYVHTKIFDEFCAVFVEESKKLKLGNGLDEGVDMGPLITQKRLIQMQEFIKIAKQNGGEILCGGKRADFEKGFFFEPTVIKNLPNDSALLCNEIFGPIALLQEFSDEEELLARVNSTEYGLASYLFTSSLQRANTIADKISAGMVGVNSFALAAAEIPFGGIKASGFGRESGVEGMFEYLNSKIITQQYRP